MNETTKANARREREGFFARYCQGQGIDIGYGGDLVLPTARGWDKEDGDAQKLEGVEDESFDYVYSSHCLEHMGDPLEALLNWWRVLKVGGYLIIAVPDEDLYEHGIWPSLHNPDHKNTFTIHKDKTWSPVSINLVDLIRHLPQHKILFLRTVDTGYDPNRTDNSDQTVGDAEAAIEVVVQKTRPDFTLRSDNAVVIRCPRCGYGRLGLECLQANRTCVLICPRCSARVEARIQF